MRNQIENFCVVLLCLVVASVASPGICAQQETDAVQENSGEQKDSKKKDELPTVEKFSEGKQYFDGFQSFYWDESSGKIWLEISNWDREFLFVYSLSTGLGSNPVGLDRGKLGAQHVCKFERVGKKVMLKARNLNYRATSDNQAEQRAVKESFAESILWGNSIAARTDDRVLVEVNSMLFSDMQGVVRTLKRSEQGDYSIDRDRSAVFLPRCKAFPKNTELEATVTFKGSKPGRYVSQVTPVPNAITLRHHFSFVELPDDQYKPRLHDPRAPTIFIRFADYSSPIDRPLEQRWITRHRLERKDSGAESSEAVEPIVYYVDAGAPQQIKDALIEGASWWNEAFEAAGFKDAFQVKVMPVDADPMDVRYNVIQWVHRSTRGWSYGGSVIDPRTGEIIKGHVTLGSLRVRQDRLLFDGMAPASMMATDENSRCACCGIIGVAEDATLASLSGPAPISDERAVETALARIRQLSAHEVGHTLGFVHNFAASTYGDRASVMDYPAPRVKVTADNQLDLSDAYGVGIGDWDKVSVRFAYTQFAEDADEAAELNKIIQESIDQKMIFISDADARPAGAAHPLANLWDNGEEPVEQLRHVMKVRKLALEKLSADSLMEGQAVADLEQLFVPIYLHHRYQLDAAAKVIGGVEYTYAVKGDGQVPLRVIAAAQQRLAFAAMLSTIDPANLVIRDSILNQLPPEPYSSLRDIERFTSSTDPIFDPHSAMRVAADMTISNLLQPQRISRLAGRVPSGQGDFDASDLVRELVEFSWKLSGDSETISARRIVRQSLLDHLLKLAGDPESSTNAKAIALYGIDQFRQRAQRISKTQPLQFANQALLRQIKRFEERPHEPATPPSRTQRPPGSPIGGK